MGGRVMTPVQSMGDADVPGHYEAIEHYVTGTQYKHHHIRVTNLSVTPLSSAPKPGELHAESELYKQMIWNTNSALFSRL